jgi:hypothetical protein
LIIRKVVDDIRGAEETVAKNNQVSKISAGLQVAEGIEGAFGSAIREVGRLAVGVDQLRESYIDLWSTRTSKLVNKTSVCVLIAARN